MSLIRQANEKAVFAHRFGASCSRQTARSLLITLVFVVCPIRLIAQGTPTLSGNNAFTGTNTFPNINNIIYVDGVKNTTLASALSSCPSIGCIVYTTVSEAWTSNVLNTAPQGTHIYFGAGKWTTTVSQTLPANVIITGEAGRNPGQQGTAIQAASGFPTTGAAVIELGSSGSAIEGTRVENMTIDCNNISDATGIYDNQAQEKSGARDVLVTTCPNVGIDVESGGQNSDWENIEVFPSSWNNTCSNCGSSTLLLKVNDTTATFRNLTLNGAGPSTNPNVGAEISESIVDFDGGIHCEGVTTTCFDLSSATLAKMSSVTCTHGAVTNLTNCIVIESGLQNTVLLSIFVDANTTNIIKDVNNSNTLTGSGEGQSVAMYVTGNGSTQPVLQSSVVQSHTFRVATLDVEGNISKGGGSFKIDDPLDPANKYLSHSFVESPDMMNIYNGTVVLDAKGQAEIELPDYFEALNRDFRYQLTPLGGYAPIYVAQEVKYNTFRIAGGTPGLKVSWQVTGIRHDAYANSHRIQVEQSK